MLELINNHEIIFLIIVLAFFSLVYDLTKTIINRHKPDIVQCPCHEQEEFEDDEDQDDE